MARVDTASSSQPEVNSNHDNHDHGDRCMVSGKLPSGTGRENPVVSSALNEIGMIKIVSYNRSTNFSF